MLQEKNIQSKSLSEFVADSASLVRKVHSTKHSLLLTENGENAAIVVDSILYEAMEERLQMLEDIYVAQEQLRSGKGVSHEDVKKDLLARFG